MRFLLSALLTAAALVPVPGTTATNTPTELRECAIRKGVLESHINTIRAQALRSQDIYSHWGEPGFVDPTYDKRPLEETQSFVEVEPGYRGPLTKCDKDQHCNESRFVLYKFKDIKSRRDAAADQLYRLERKSAVPLPETPDMQFLRYEASRDAFTNALRKMTPPKGGWMDDFGAEIHMHFECRAADNCKTMPIEVIFRGTNLKRMADIKNDVDQFRDLDPAYYNHARTLVQSIQSAAQGRPLIISGHSLGGGLATYAGANVPNAVVFAFNPAGVNKNLLARAGVPLKEYERSPNVYTFIAYDRHSSTTDVMDYVNRKASVKPGLIEPDESFSDTVLRFNQSFYIPIPRKQNADGVLTDALRGGALHSIDTFADALTQEGHGRFTDNMSCDDLLGKEPGYAAIERARKYIQNMNIHINDMYWRQGSLVDSCPRRAITVKQLVGATIFHCHSTGSEYTQWWDDEGNRVAHNLQIEQKLPARAVAFLERFNQITWETGAANWARCASRTSGQDPQRKILSRISNNGRELRYTCVRGDGSVVFDLPYQIVSNGTLSPLGEK